MNERNIYNHALSLDVFCFDIIEGWMNWQKAIGRPIASYEFAEWVDEFTHALEYNFGDVYEEKFGHREDEDEE